MYIPLIGLCDNAATTVQAVPAFADAYDEFKTHTTNIQTLGKNQEQTSTGVAEGKKAARNNMCELAAPIAGALHAYAVKTSNHTLAAQVDFTVSDLKNGPAQVSLERCQNIEAAAKVNVMNAATFGLKPAKVEALYQAITAFAATMGSPAMARATGRTVTYNLNTEFEAADAALELMDDLIDQLADTDAKFVSDYRNARVIVDSAASHASPKKDVTTTGTATPSTKLANA